jgi:error-prone DNA polymerase
VWRRAKAPVRVLERLAEADAWTSTGLDRRRAIWQIRALGDEPLPLFAAAEARAMLGDNRPPIELGNEPEVTLPTMPLGEAVLEDYRVLRLSLKAHPLSLLRPQLREDGVIPASALPTVADGKRVTVAGLVLVRQRPATASGVIFATLEDETGIVNIIIWPSMLERFRAAVLGARLLAVRGRLQREGMVTHVIGDAFVDWSPYLSRLNSLDDPAAAPAAADALPAARDFR